MLLLLPINSFSFFDFILCHGFAQASVSWCLRHATRGPSWGCCAKSHTWVTENKRNNCLTVLDQEVEVKCWLLLRGSLEEGLALSLLRGFWETRALLGLQLCHFNLCSHLHMALSSCVFCPNFPLLKEALVLRLGVTSVQHDYTKLIWSTKTCF
jgi:hypothetical protein